MKYLTLFIALFSFNSIAFSQDSITIKTEVDTFSQANYEGQFDYVFARKEPKKQLFKTGILGYSVGSDVEFFAYEKKISKDMSLHFSFNTLSQGEILLGNGRLLSNRGTEDTITVYESKPSFAFSIEPRWYFNMKKDIAKGLIANNFHGSYIGLRTSYEIEVSSEKEYRYLKDSSLYVTPKDEYNTYISSELCIGIQRRILKYQYIDFGIGTGFRTRITTQIPTDQKRTQWIFNYRLAYGFLLNKVSKTATNGAKCEALRCFEEERSMWKIGLNNLINEFNQRKFSGILSIAYEQKIPKTMWSVETSLAIGGNLYSKTVESVPKYDNRYGFTIGVMPRYYHDQRRDIAKGKSADNLSGIYLGAKLTYGQTERFDNLQVQYADAALIWGWQQRLLNHLYYDLSLGYLFSRAKIKQEVSYSNGLNFNFSLGLAF
jgi:hypothetical protein